MCIVAQLREYLCAVPLHQGSSYATQSPSLILRSTSTVSFFMHLKTFNIFIRVLKMPMHLLQNLLRLEKSLRADKREHATFHCTFLAGHHTLTASNIRLNYLEEYVLPIQCSN